MGCQQYRGEGVETQGMGIRRRDHRRRIGRVIGRPGGWGSVPGMGIRGEGLRRGHGDR